VKTSLVLTGGGARGAYQAGSLKALGEIYNSGRSPFSILSGSSAGAINSVFLASKMVDFSQATEELTQFWEALDFNHVVDMNVSTLSRIFIGYMSDFVSAMTAGKASRSRSRSLMNTDPLAKMLKEIISFDDITTHQKNGFFEALVVTATQYRTSNTVHFVQSHQPFTAWHGWRSKSIATEISRDHVLASSAIPVFFPPHKVDGEFFGDGSIRNVNPLSPSIHLGAEKLFIVGLRNASEEVEFAKDFVPSLSRICSLMLNSLFLDAVDADLQQLKLNNKICREVCELEDRHIRPIQHFHLYPSKDISQIAYEHIDKIPSQLKRFLLGMGTLKEASALMSYLLFDPEYCGALVELGYMDTMARKAEVESFLSDEGISN
jgi:NTE family protein